MIRYTMGPHVEGPGEKTYMHSHNMLAEDLHNLFWAMARAACVPQIVTRINRKIA